MWTEQKPEVQPLTKEYLEWFRALPQLRGDRQIDARRGMNRLGWLSAHLDAGTFYSPHWGIAICRENNAWYRVNGNTSSTALAMANGHFPQNSWVIVQTFECDTMEDMTALFDTFDNRKSIRSETDKTNVHKSLHEELASVRPNSIRWLLAGIVFYQNGGRTKMDDDARIALIHGEVDYLVWGATFMRERALRKTGVAAAMYRSFRADPEFADEFWTMVQKANMPPDHASRTIKNLLVDELIPGEMSGWDSRAIYVKCIHAWNAWQKGETTSLNYKEAAPIPKLWIKRKDGYKAY